MRSSIIAGCMLGMAICGAPSSRAATLHVPADYATIQAAIDAAVDGDTVLVEPGTYLEHIDFLHKGIAVTSSQGAGVTIIEGTNEIVSIRDAAMTPTFEGFTVRNGTTGIRCAFGFGLGASTTNIMHNRITGCSSGITCYGNTFAPGGRVVVLDDELTGNGVGVVVGSNTIAEIRDSLISGNGRGILVSGDGYYYGASALIEHNIIMDNHATGDGGAISVGWRSGADIAHNTIVGNTASNGGGAIFAGGDLSHLVVRDNLIASNSAKFGGGLRLAGGVVDATLARNTFFANGADAGGALSFDGGWQVDITDCILWQDTAPTGPEIEVGASTVTISYSDVEGGLAGVSLGSGASFSWGAGMIESDPQWVSPAKRNFALRDGSPCIDAGNPATDASCYGRDLSGDARLMDGLLTGIKTVDMGAREYANVQLTLVETRTTGKVKAVQAAGEIVLHASGKPGMPVMLFVGTKEDVQCARQYGTLFLDLASPWWVFAFGSIPSTVVAPAPDVPAPIALILQALALDPSGAVGNLSNAIELTLN